VTRGYKLPDTNGLHAPSCLARGSRARTERRYASPAHLCSSVYPFSGWRRRSSGTCMYMSQLAYKTVAFTWISEPRRPEGFSPFRQAQPPKSTERPTDRRSLDTSSRGTISRLGSMTRSETRLSSRSSIFGILIPRYETWREEGIGSDLRSDSLRAGQAAHLLTSASLSAWRDFASRDFRVLLRASIDAE